MIWPKKVEYYKTQNLLSHIKMDPEILKFDGIEIIFFQKILVSKKIFTVEKNYEYFHGNIYDDYKFKLLHIMLPKTSAYVTSKWTGIWWTN